MSSKTTAEPGDYNPDRTPWVRGMHDALDDPLVKKMVAMKSAQIAWTDGVLLNYVAKKIDLEPCAMIIMFAKEKAAKEFSEEKFVPMAEVTPRLAAKLQIQRRKNSDNRWDYKSFGGGFLKLVGSNSPSSVKSTPAPIVAVEEPDDCNDNVREQGDTITLLEERVKTFPRSKVVFGGTPTVKGVSKIETAYLSSDQRKFFIPCHHCGETHVLAWENVTATEDPEFVHENFGHTRPETARYICPHCGAAWNDAEKNHNVTKGVWIATAAFYGIAGFYINELYSPFPGSVLQELMKKFLVADHLLRAGDDTKMRAFRNSTEGLPYEYKSDVPKADALAARAEDYPEMTVPWGGGRLTVGVDVQHNRLAIVIRAWGRGMESWLVYWGEIYGQTLIENSGAWLDLDALLNSEILHASGNPMPISAVSVDSSDGTTTDAVYAYVRKRAGRNYMAIKGASEQSGTAKEIFAKPSQSIDVRGNHTPHPSGVRPYIVGTNRAKDLMIDGRLSLTGKGPGRLHWYKSVRPDYWDQITSEVKTPHKKQRNRFVWTPRAGVRNEALDCEVYALHAAMSLKLHLLKPSYWDAIDMQLRQKQMFFPADPVPLAVPLASEEPENEDAQPQAVAPAAEPTPALKPKTPKLRQQRRVGGFSANSW
jgi:phage terminase large subunit GpA-like protein